MLETKPDVFTPMPLSQDDIHKLIGALYLEIDVLRRYVQQLRAHIDRNGTAPPPAPSP